MPTLAEASFASRHFLPIFTTRVSALTNHLPKARAAALEPAGMWVLAPDGSRLTRRFVAKNFLEAMSFLNDAAAVAERPDVSHHPDFHLTT